MENNKNFEKREPKVEVKFALSKDKKWFITRTVITEIKPVSYINKVLAGNENSQQGVSQ